MRIAKPFRILIESATAGGFVGFAAVLIGFYFASPWRELSWALLLPIGFVVWLLTSFPIGALDVWLRRVTRDR